MISSSVIINSPSSSEMALILVKESATTLSFLGQYSTLKLKSCNWCKKEITPDDYKKNRGLCNKCMSMFLTAIKNDEKKKDNFLKIFNYDKMTEIKKSSSQTSRIRIY